MSLGKIKGVEGCEDKSVQLFEDDKGNITGYCFALSKFVEDPFGNKTEEEKAAMVKAAKKPKSTTDILEEMEAIANCTTAEVLERGLDKKILGYFEVKQGLCERDGKTPKYVLFPATVKGTTTGYFCRLLERKAMWTIGNVADAEPFGWKQALVKLKSGAKRLYITEGQYDAVALQKIIATNDKNMKFTKPACISLPNGVASVKSLGKYIKDIEEFSEVILAFDDDDAGHLAEKQAAMILPKAKVVRLPCKDANQCLIEGKGQDAWKAATFSMKEAYHSAIVKASDLHEEARKPEAWGYDWPWPSFTQKTRGLRTKETIYIGAGEKMGKSELVDHLAAWFSGENGIPILLIKPEQNKNKTYKKVAGKVVGKVFHDPSIEFDEVAYDKAKEFLDKLYILDNFQGIEWGNVVREIRLAASLDVKIVFIDPLTNLVDGLAAAEKNVLLQKIAREATVLAQDLDIAIIFTCHLNTPPEGKSWASDCNITSKYFAGSRGMAQCCDIMMAFGGDKANEDEAISNTRYLSVIEAREFEHAKVNLSWERSNGLFTEI